MAKAIITFSDNEDGTVTVTTDFRPVISETFVSNAQSDALAMLQTLRNQEGFFDALADESVPNG